MRTRTNEIFCRKFLANTCKRDNADAQLQSYSGISSYSCTFYSLEDMAKDEGCAIQVTLFDFQKSRFFGNTHRLELFDMQPLEPFALCCDPLTTTLVVEVIKKDDNDNDTVSCWGEMKMSSITDTREVTLKRGSAQRLLIPAQSKITKGEQPAGRLNWLIQPLIGGLHLHKLVPPGFAVPMSFVETRAPHNSGFRLDVSQVMVSSVVPGMPIVTEPNCHWSLCAVIHNSYTALSQVRECDLHQLGGGVLSCANETILEFNKLPLHKDTTLVLALRYHKKRGPSTLGFAAFPLCYPNEPADKDIFLKGLSVLRGPFSSIDSRLLMRELQQPHEPLPMNVGLKLSFFNTPTPPPMRAIRVADEGKKRAPDNKKEEHHKTTKNQTAAQLTTTEAQPHPEFESKSQPQEVSAGEASRRMQGFVPTSAQTDPEIYKILENLTKDIIAIREKIDKGPFTEEIVETHFEQRETKTTLRSHEPEHVEIVKLHPRRVGISLSTRTKLRAKVPRLSHPSKGSRLVDGEVATEELPLSRLMICFAGITVSLPDVSSIPERLTVVFCFGPHGPKRFGTLCLQMCETDAVGKTYFLQEENTDTPPLWVEPETDYSALTLQKTELFRNFYSKGVVYLNFFDATSSFYFATAILNLRDVYRSSGISTIVRELSLPLCWDPSFGSFVQTNYHPLHADCGHLLVTVANVGLPIPLLIAHAGAEPKPSKTVVVPKIHVDFGDIPTETEAQVTPNVGAQPREDLFGKQQQKHALRAEYVKKLAKDEGAFKKILECKTNMGNSEMEYRLKFVEKRRDEVKSRKIAETLRERITTLNKVCVASGRPEVMQVLFTNPFPQSVRFLLEIPPEDRRFLSLLDECPQTVVLGPKEVFTVPLVVRVSAFSELGNCAVSCIIKTEKLVVTRIITIEVQPAPPVPDRHYTIRGPPGSTIRRTFFARSIGEAFEANPDSLAKRLGLLCTFPCVSDPDFKVASEAQFDEFTTSKIAAWENLVVVGTVPEQGEKDVFVHLYLDQHLTKHWETWEITLAPCDHISSPPIAFGQTNVVHLPLLADKVFCHDSNVRVLPSDHLDLQGGVKLEVKPREVGTQIATLHAVRGGRYIWLQCELVCQLPEPTHEMSLSVPAAQTKAPLFYTLPFTNNTGSHKLFRIEYNYKCHVQINPSVISLGIGDTKEIKITIHDLQAPPSGSQCYPVRIFINDSDDKTVAFYVMNILVNSPGTIF